MRVVVIGGKGHVGTYLIPRLVENGFDVVNVSRGQSQPYLKHPAWNKVKQVDIDRKKEETSGDFGKHIQDLNPDIVIDMICFTRESAQQLVEALKGKIRHLLTCGTVWVHGPGVERPTKEDQARNPFGDYGIQKAEMEEYLLCEARVNQLPVTILHPGHIVGPGYVPINPLGNTNLEVYNKLAREEILLMPNLGMETLHHVHADDVAQGFIKAIEHWSNAIGESFHLVSPAAITMKGYAEKVASWFNRQAKIEYSPWDEWKQWYLDNIGSNEDINLTYDHIAHSPCVSIEKARSQIDYQPRYTSLEAVYEALQWLIDNEKINSK